MSFLTAKPAGKVIAIFDVSSSSVAGAHALLPQSGSPATILASYRIDATLQEDIDIKRFVEETSKNLSEVAHKLHKADVHKPDHIQIVLASPWYVSQTRTVWVKNEVETVCTKKVIDDLVKKEIDYVMEHEFEKFGTAAKDAMVVEKQISQIKLNGYQVSNPYGKSAQTIELALTITVVPKKIVSRLTDSLRRQYGTRHISVTTSPYATYVVARDYFGADKDLMIIDVGEEVTDIAFVRNNLFLYQHSFPIGTYGLYRSIATKSNSTILETKALVETYRLGKSSATSKNKIDKALATFSEDWAKSLQSVLSENQYGFCLPDKSFIVSDKRFEGVFPDILSKDAYIQHACGANTFVPTFFNSEMLSSKVRTLDDELDIPIALGILFVTRMM